MATLTGQFQQQLIASGIPADFSVVNKHQSIPSEILSEIDRFIAIFEQVTARPEWVEYAFEGVSNIAKIPHKETCFFSAWDIHIPPVHPDNWQLIEFNDNGSGFLFAGLLNHLYYELFLSEQHFISEQSFVSKHSFLPMHNYGTTITPPPSYAELCNQIKAMITAEANAFFGQQTNLNRNGILLILDDADSLHSGKFRNEHLLMTTLAQDLGWKAAIDSPESLVWNGKQLQINNGSVAFIINRSTDFLWQSETLKPLIEAYRAGCVYVAPNPYSYTTRSDKRLLEFLSRPDWDNKLGIKDYERAILSRHIPATYQLTDESICQLAQHKDEFIFKPTHGHASLGVLDSHEVGRHRLHRLLNKGHLYIAQRIAEKSKLTIEDNQSLWTDLRVWAYKGKRYQISGRASVTKERLNLHSPGGWVPTFEAKKSQQKT
ncbi:hypothetical protein [uncultured Photobacterium sp.]|uniref:hypothetical protein n=1 Tax=uncultured Photobacterium sp. TaxID=173973 RepID=UPI00261963CA|nr:hypothetical protein [uncultured Photobacterium sp.]